MRNRGWFIGKYYYKNLTLKWGIEKGPVNQVADHLSLLEDEAIRELGDKTYIDDTFPDEHV